MGGKAGAIEYRPQPTVNNFAGAGAPHQDSDGFRDSFPLSASSVFPPRRVRSANVKSH
jgi:hypothetical protein